MSEHTIDYGTTPIRFELSYAARKTLGITVHPEDLRVTVTAPEGADLAAVKAHVHKRAAWILAQQEELARYWPPVPPREYVSGEAHWLLGRKLRLKVIESPVDIVKPTRTHLQAFVRNTAPAHVRRVVHTWYRRRAKVVFPARLEACYPKAQHLGIAMPEVRVRAMEARWGSTRAPDDGGASEGTITLNTKLVQAPLPCIDYVIYHELAHIAAPDHGAGFQALLSRLEPEWEMLRERLNTFRGE